MSAAAELLTYITGCTHTEQSALVHDNDGGGQWEGFLEAVLGQKDGRTQFAVDLAQRGQKL